MGTSMAIMTAGVEARYQRALQIEEGRKIFKQGKYKIKKVEK